jgi:hypothetical protein
VRVPSRTEIVVDSIAEGIAVGATLKEDEDEPTEPIQQDSEMDENHYILDLERRDFNDVEGIEEEDNAEI